MNTQPRYIKSFSHGQITIPKEIREEFGMGDEFWLKLYTQDRKIVVEPVARKKTKDEYGKELLAIKSVWFGNREVKEIMENRKQLKKRFTKLDL